MATLRRYSDPYSLEEYDIRPEVKLIDSMGVEIGQLCVRARKFVFQRRRSVKSVLLNVQISFRGGTVGPVGVQVEIPTSELEEDTELLVKEVLSVSLGVDAARWMVSQLLGDRVNVSGGGPSYLSGLEEKESGITARNFLEPKLTEGLQVYIANLGGAETIVLDKKGSGKPLAFMHGTSEVIPCQPCKLESRGSLLCYLIGGVHLGS